LKSSGSVVLPAGSLLKMGYTECKIGAEAWTRKKGRGEGKDGKGGKRKQSREQAPPKPRKMFITAPKREEPIEGLGIWRGHPLRILGKKHRQPMRYMEGKE